MKLASIQNNIDSTFQVERKKGKTAASIRIWKGEGVKKSWNIIQSEYDKFYVLDFKKEDKTLFKT